MRRLIIVLLFLVFSVGLGLFVVRHPGYLLIVYQPWMVQMPLWFALLGFLIVFTLFYVLIDSIDQCQFWWFRVKNWFRRRREHKSYSKTQQGLALLIEGQWKKAERLLLAGIDQTVEPLMNYLGAAKAAHELGAFDRRDMYIQKAHQVAPNAEVAIGLTQAEFEYQQEQFEHAAATLNHLLQTSPRQPRVLKLLEKVYVRISDWKRLQLLLPTMRKAKILNREQADQFEKNLYCSILNAGTTITLDQLHQIWNDMPRAMRKNPDVVTAYIKQLRRFGDTTETEELIRKTLKSSWQPELARVYGTLPFTNLNRQLVIVGAWLKMYGPQPELLVMLGKLCVRVQLWGKAKDYFDKCLALGPNAEASLEYGKLLEHLGDVDEAREKYQAGLAQLVAVQPVLLQNRA